AAREPGAGRLAPGGAAGMGSDLELHLEELLARRLGGGSRTDRARQPGLLGTLLGLRLRLGGLGRLHPRLLLLAGLLLGGLLLSTVEHPAPLRVVAPQPNPRGLPHGALRRGSLDSRFDPLLSLDWRATTRSGVSTLSQPDLVVVGSGFFGL